MKNLVGKNELSLIILGSLLTLVFSRIFSPASLLSVIFWCLLWLIIFCSVFLVEKIFFLRRFVFIFLAILFLFGFRLFLFDYNDLFGICPLVASTLIGGKLKTIFSVGKYFYLFLFPLVFLLLILWLGLRWCSFGCFWGGWNELFGSIFSKSIVQFKKAGYFRETPVALWLFFSITSLTGGGILFCLVLCPFKLSSIPAKTTYFLGHLWFPVLLLAVIVLPLLTKKHFFCRFFCPLKGFISLLGNKSGYLRINEKKCNYCNRCISFCPEMAIGESSSGIKIDSAYCTYCLKCYSFCPQQAIEVISSGNLLSEKELRREVFFIMVVSAVMNSFWGPAAFQHLLGLR